MTYSHMQYQVSTWHQFLIQPATLVEIPLPQLESCEGHLPSPVHPQWVQTESALELFSEQIPHTLYQIYQSEETFVHTVKLHFISKTEVFMVMKMQILAL